MTTAGKTRQTLLNKIKNQYDEKAWKEFISFYRPYIYRIIQNHYRINNVDREDIIQEVLLVSWKKLPEFEYSSAKGRFRSWLGRVTTNTTLAFNRKNNKEKSLSDSQVFLEGNQAAPPEIEKVYQQEWEKHITDRAWANISSMFEEKVLETFTRLSSGEEGKTVAEDLGLSLNSVYVYKKRVLAAFQKEIAYLDDEINT